MILYFSIFFAVPVKLREVHLKPNNVPSTAEDGLSTSEEIVFYCFPMLDGIVDPHTVVVDVEWWVEDQLVIEESFNLKAKSSGILQPQFWKMGQTVSEFFRVPLGAIFILCKDIGVGGRSRKWQFSLTLCSENVLT